MTEAVTEDYDDMFENIDPAVVATPSEEPTPATTTSADDGLVITFGGEEFSIPMTQDLR